MESPTKAVIHSFVRELQALMASDDSTAYTAGFLVTGMRRCLAAHGASLWISVKHGLHRAEQLCLIRTDGRPASPEFASDVIAASVSIVRRESTDVAPFLHIGVPISSNKSILGVIEIAQRDVGAELTQRGYIRFISQMAEIAVPLALKLQR
tara:strand:- start:202 stop:657 length:456 start_codon:yes stop_codon:yes gene_type:complete